MQHLPSHPSFAAVKAIEKGWSADRKYYVERMDGTKCLLRLSDAAQRAAKQAEFDLLSRVAVLGLPVSRPIAFGQCPDGGPVYMLLGWCEGEDAETTLPTLPETAQYALGVEAGGILRSLHTLPPPDTAAPWGARYGRKAEGKIAQYTACPIQFDGGGAMVDYVRRCLPLLHGRLQCCQHGDYHVGNMILAPGGHMSVIDFNRRDVGDPWEEFNRITFSAAASPAFASGQIDGYFGGEPPMAFFELMAFYIAVNTLGSIAWAIPFGDADVQSMLQNARQALRWYDGMRSAIPAWYTPGPPADLTGK